MIVEGKIMKAESKTFRGIEYVEVDELPQNQKEKLLQTINKNLYIKILIDNKIVGNCLQYKDYLNWFNTVYLASKAVANQPSSIEVSSLRVSFGPAYSQTPSGIISNTFPSGSSK